VARLRCALKPEDRFGAGRVIRKHYQPSNVADLEHCLNIWLGQQNDRIHHMRQAEAIKAGIKPLIAARDHASGLNPKSETRRKDALCSEWRQNGQDGKVASTHGGVQTAGRRTNEDLRKH
jgi:hypothetical protein